MRPFIHPPAWLGFPFVALFVLLLPVTTAAQEPESDVVHETQILQPDGLEEGADFGFDLALTSDWLFAGEPGRFEDYGGVKNFRRSEDTWSANAWNFDPDATDAFSLARFGQALSVDERDDGSFYLSIGQARSYSALFGSAVARTTSYYYDGANWVWDPSLPSAKGPTSGHDAENFANSLAVSSSGQSPTVLVGVPLRPGTEFLSLGDDPIQDYDLGGGISTRPLGVAIEGDRAAIGYGSTVIVLERAEGGVDFVETLTIEAPEGTSRFGASVALEGDHLLVGAPDSDVAGATRAGKVFLFDLTDPEAPTQTFEMAEPVSYERLGWGVAFGEDFVAASAPGGDGVFEAVKRDGRVAIFDPETGELRNQLIAETPSSEDYFGRSLAVNGRTLMAGAPTRDGTGAIFIFQVPAPEPTAVLLQLAALLTLAGIRRRRALH